MTPVPFRGARNEPQYIGYTARELAKAREMDAEEFASQVTINARRIYGL